MHWVEFFIGPQLIGAVFLLAGLIQKRWPPKKINGLYGYRTSSSMKNQETWDEGNRFAAAYMIRVSYILIVAGLLITLLLNYIPIPQKFKVVILFLSVMGAAMGTAIGLLMATERHLEKKFDHKE